MAFKYGNALAAIPDSNVRACLKRIGDATHVIGGNLSTLIINNTPTDIIARAATATSPDVSFSPADIGVSIKYAREDHRHLLDHTIDANGGNEWTGIHVWQPDSNAVPITISKTASLTSANLFDILDTDDSPLVRVDNLGLVGINCQPDTDSMLTIQGVESGIPFQSSLAAWWKSDSIVDANMYTPAPPSNNQPLGTVDDSSGNGRTLIAHGGSVIGGDTDITANYPRYYTPGGAHGGLLPLIDLQGSESGDQPYGYFEFLSRLDLDPTAGWTAFFMVLSYTTENAQEVTVMGGNQALDGSDCFIRRQRSTVSIPADRARWLSSDVGTTLVYENLRAVSAPPIIEIAAVRCTTSGILGVMELWINGTLQPNSSPHSRGATTQHFRYIGREHVSAGINHQSTGLGFYEIAVYNRRLSDDEVADVNNYFIARRDGTSTAGSFDLTHWNDEAAATMSLIDGTGQFGFGVASPSAPVHLVGTNPLIRFGAGGVSTALSLGTQAGDITYTLPTASAVGLLHNSAGSAWSWSAVDLASVDVSGVLPIARGGTNSGTALSGSSIVISNGTAIVQGAAGTTTTVLHGNASGAPSYGAVSLTADVNGDLPYANVTPASAASLLLGRGSASGAGDWQEITLGSNLTMTGTVLDSTGGGGGAVPISTTDAEINTETFIDGATLSGTAASIDVSSIPATYDDLIIRFEGRTDSASSNGAFVYFNNDTTATNYQTNLKGSLSPSTEVIVSTDDSQCIFMPKTTQESNAFSVTEIVIPNYLYTSKRKLASILSHDRRHATANSLVSVGSLDWESTAAIDRITITNNGGNFVAGTRWQLLGRKRQTFITSVSGSTGTVTGTGTTTYLPLWDDGAGGVLADSHVTDDGTEVFSSLPVRVRDATGVAQLQLEYNASVFASIKVAGSDSTRFDATGDLALRGGSTYLGGGRAELSLEATGGGRFIGGTSAVSGAAGGSFSISGGAGLDSPGGTISAFAGAATGTGDFDGGDILLGPSTGIGAGRDGHIQLYQSSNSFGGILDFESLSADRTFVYPNQSGTLLLDIDLAFARHALCGGI